mmetsp:Transcript_58962/g.157632  ORF Transcript_58962/g.157632 Transcript_58962/m.157632 type:complete len:296 (-) Transcript_58962:811-1698(-)
MSSTNWSKSAKNEVTAVVDASLLPPWTTRGATILEVTGGLKLAAFSQSSPSSVCRALWDACMLRCSSMSTRSSPDIRTSWSASHADPVSPLAPGPEIGGPSTGATGRFIIALAAQNSLSKVWKCLSSCFSRACCGSLRREINPSQSSSGVRVPEASSSKISNKSRSSSIVAKAEILFRISSLLRQHSTSSCWSKDPLLFTSAATSSSCTFAIVSRTVASIHLSCASLSLLAASMDTSTMIAVTKFMTEIAEIPINEMKYKAKKGSLKQIGRTNAVQLSRVVICSNVSMALPMDPK